MEEFIYYFLFIFVFIALGFSIVAISKNNNDKFDNINDCKQTGKYCKYNEECCDDLNCYDTGAGERCYKCVSYGEDCYGEECCDGLGCYDGQCG